MKYWIGLVMPCHNKLHCVYRMSHHGMYGLYYVTAARIEHSWMAAIPLGLLVLLIIGIIIKEEG